VSTEVSGLAVLNCLNNKYEMYVDDFELFTYFLRLVQDNSNNVQKIVINNHIIYKKV